MEIPRFSRVGNVVAENKNIILRAAVALSIGALVKVVASRLPAAKSAAEQSAARQTVEEYCLGAQWQELTESDFLDNAA
jgi:hypothetical protein